MRNGMLFLVLSLVLAAPATVMACSCLKPTAAEAMQSVDIVFRGELIEHRGGAAVFRVDEQWKGNLGGRVEVQWREGNHGDCNGFWPDQLKIGNKLLVFAGKDSHGIYRTNICLPTKPIADAAVELKELGPGKPARRQ